MEIIKDAFVEGRETDTEWDKSKSKRDSITLEVELENFSAMKARTRSTLMPLHKICPETGKVLAKFPSRLAACRHIVRDILKRPEKNPLSIGGNLEIGMRGGWKSYGFYWKIADASEGAKEINGIKVPQQTGAMKIYARVRTKVIVFNNQYEAAAHFGVCRKRIRSLIKDQKGNNKFLDGGILQKYNDTPRTLEFRTVDEAAKFANCSSQVMASIIKEGQPINNYTYVINRKVVPEPKYVITGYTVRSGNMVETFTNTKDITKAYGVHRTTIAKCIKTGKALKGRNMVIKPRYSIVK